MQNLLIHSFEVILNIYRFYKNLSPVKQKKWYEN